MYTRRYYNDDGSRRYVYQLTNEPLFVDKDSVPENYLWICFG